MEFVFSKESLTRFNGNFYGHLPAPSGDEYMYYIDTYVVDCEYTVCVDCLVAANLRRPISERFEEIIEETDQRFMEFFPRHRWMLQAVQEEEAALEEVESE